MKVGAGENTSRDRAVHSQEFGSGEPNRFNLHGFTRGNMPLEPGNM